VILQMLRKTMCRVLLLVVCLGLGMVHPSLEKKQVILVSLLGVVRIDSRCVDSRCADSRWNSLRRTQAPHFAPQPSPSTLRHPATLLPTYLHLSARPPNPPAHTTNRSSMRRYMMTRCSHTACSHTACFHTDCFHTD
jgi:hypothetical protein